MPTAPFSNINHLAFLCRTMLPSQYPIQTYFSDTTVPTKATVEYLQQLKAAELQAAYAEFGFVIPLVAATDETWTEFQTYLLQSQETAGVLGAIGDSLLPAPALASGDISSNANQQRWELFLDHIRNTGAGLRAKYRYGSRAQKVMLEPAAPTTDVISGRKYGYTDGYSHDGISQDTFLLLDYFIYRGQKRAKQLSG